MSAREELAAIQERLANATPGPWEWVPSAVEGGSHVLGVVGESGFPVLRTSPYAPPQQRDAEFIAHARTDVPRLVKALEAVLERADEWAASPAVGVSSEEQWELDTLRIVAATLRHDITKALTTDTKGDAR